MPVLLLCFVFTQLWASTYAYYSPQQEMTAIVAEAVGAVMKDRPISNEHHQGANGAQFLRDRQNQDSTAIETMSRGYQEDEQFAENVGRCADIVLRATHLMLSRGDKRLTREEFQRAMAPLCPKRHVHCNPKFRFRSPDGTCNNLQNPLLGASMTSQSRFLQPQYGDQFNLGLFPRTFSVRGEELPNPRNISNAVLNGGDNPPKSKIHTNVLAYFGQFIGHDVAASPNIQRGKKTIQCCMGNLPIYKSECFPIMTRPNEFQTTCMNFVRTEFVPEKGCPPGRREQINQATSYIDLSVTYGSSLEKALDLRDIKSGRLKEGHGGLLPDGPSDNCMGRTMCFKGGDDRHTETPTLTAFHTVFLREHNRIVELLRQINPHWDGERLYQEARRINIAQYQHFVFNEYLPAILGTDAVQILGLSPKQKGYSNCYDHKIDGSTRNAFAGAAFRFGHSMIGSRVEFYDSSFRQQRWLPLENEYFSSASIRNSMEYGIDRIIRWLVTDFTSKSDRLISSSVRNRLFQTEDKNGFDLCSRDIQRGRDHGLPSYNKFRMHCGLPPILSFGIDGNGLDTHDPLIARKLGRLYKHPEDIDLMVGALTELPMKASLVGPTFGCLIGQQFRNFKCGDRFYYENNHHATKFTKDQLNIIKSQTLSSVFCRTTGVQSLQRNSFVAPTQNGNQHVPCHSLPQLGIRELHAWKGL